MYKIDPAFQKSLESFSSFVAEGPVRILSSSVHITPKDVSWTEDRTHFTAPGAGLAAHVKWDTPPDSPNAAHGRVYIRFPELTGKTISFHSGGYQKDDQGHFVLREVTAYRSNLALSFARLVFALSAGLPFGILLHSILWAFVLKTEKRSRLAALPEQGPDLPRTFYPNPILEWTLWTLLFGIGAFVSSIMAGVAISDGFMSSSMAWVSYIFVAIGAAIGLVSAYFTSKSVLTVRVEANGMSYAHGRADLQWLNASWWDILHLSQKSRTYRGTTREWLVIEFKDNRKKLKVTQNIEGYPILRDLLLRVVKP